MTRSRNTEHRLQQKQGKRNQMKPGIWMWCKYTILNKKVRTLFYYCSANSFNDVELLFTNIFNKGTIDFSCEEIYVQKKLEPICKKSIFKKLLYKLIFNNLDEVTVEKLKFRPMVDQTGTATYDAAKVIGECLKPLALNENKINDCLKFPDMIKALLPLQKNEEYVSNDVDSLFTNIPLKETIDYIIHKVYNETFLKPFCKKSYSSECSTN